MFNNNSLLSYALLFNSLTYWVIQKKRRVFNKSYFDEKQVKSGVLKVYFVGERLNLFQAFCFIQIINFFLFLLEVSSYCYLGMLLSTENLMNSPIGVRRK